MTLQSDSLARLLGFKLIISFLGFPLDDQKSREELFNLANRHHVVIILHGPTKVEITLFQHNHQEPMKKNYFE